MKDPRPLVFRVPTDLRKWLEQQAGMRKMTLTDYCMQLLAKGIQAETIDESVARLQAATESGVVREILRQTLATRHMVEMQAKGMVRIPETLGTEALAWADRQLGQMLPTGERHDDQPQQ